VTSIIKEIQCWEDNTQNKTSKLPLARVGISKENWWQRHSLPTVSDTVLSGFQQVLYSGPVFYVWYKETKIAMHLPLGEAINNCQWFVMRWLLCVNKNRIASICNVLTTK
jgi:hypothetical protein